MVKKLCFVVFLVIICISTIWAQSAQTHINNGIKFRDQGNYDAAIREYSEAIRINPNFAEAYKERGYAYSLKGDYNRAIADYTESIRLNPNKEVYHSRGQSYLHKGDYNRAIADLTESIRIDPNYDYVYLTYWDRGKAYAGKGDYSRAIVDYNESIRLYSRLFPDARASLVYEDRGNAYLAIGDYDRAISDYEKLMREAPELTTVFKQYIEDARKQKQASSVAQQPQTNNNQQRSNTQSSVQRLTYYINGRSKTVNAEFVGLDQSRFYLDNGGNILRSVRGSKPDGTWHDWENQGVVIRGQGRNIINAWGIFGVLLREVNFNNATEERQGNNRLIYIYKKYNNDNFMSIEGDYVYTLQEVWKEVR